MDNNEKVAAQEATQAPPVIGPSFVENAIKDLRDERADKPEDIAVREQKILAEGSESDFWVIIKKRLEGKTQSMRNAFSQRLGEGKIDLADVGVRSLIINEVADAYKEVIDMVEHARKKQIAGTQEVDPNLPETVGPDDEKPSNPIA